MDPNSDGVAIPPVLVCSVLIAYAAILLALAVIVPGPWISTGHLLEFASAVVGWIGGGRFRDANRTRDQLAFIASAGAFLFLAALEYDYKLLGSLEKIGGSEFSVEFSNEGGIDKSKTQELGPSAPPIDNYLSSSFTGAATIDLAVDTLTDYLI